jgi:hypothetical protein
MIRSGNADGEGDQRSTNAISHGMWEGAHVTLLQNIYGRALGFGEYAAGRKCAALAEM